MHLHYHLTQKLIFAHITINVLILFGVFFLLTILYIKNVQDLVVLDEVMLLVAQRYMQEVLAAEEENTTGGRRMAYC